MMVGINNAEDNGVTLLKSLLVRWAQLSYYTFSLKALKGNNKPLLLRTTQLNLRYILLTIQLRLLFSS